MNQNHNNMDAGSIIDGQAWSESRMVAIRAGFRRVRTAVPNQKFWKLWREDRSAVTGRGISVRKDDSTGEWSITEWRTMDDEETPETIRMREEDEQSLRAARWVPDLAINEAGLLPFQIDGAKRLTNALLTHGSALDASDMGVGKSYMGLNAALNVSAKVAIIAPKVSIGQWERVALHFFRLFGVYPLFLLNWEKLRTGRTRWVRREATGQGEVMRWNLPAGTVVVCDEVHMAKAYPPSLNAQLVVSLAAQGFRTLMMSATPATGAHEMYALGYALKLWQQDFIKWASANGAQSTQYGYKQGSKKAMLALHKQIFPAMGNRMRKQDIEGFPENHIIPDAWVFDSSVEIQKVYDEMNAELAALAKKEKASRGRNEALVIMLRARQRTELLKIPGIAERAKSMVEQGFSVPIFVNFSDSIDALAQRLGTDCIIQGGQTATVRNANVDKFNQGKSKLILCNIKAGGVSISLHDTTNSHPRIALICPTFSAFELKQASGRHCRTGGGNVTTYIIFAAGTVEEVAMVSVAKKLSNLDSLVDGDLDLNPMIQSDFADNVPGAQP
jgi:superfamily II DNA or RNA helicase